MTKKTVRKATALNDLIHNIDIFLGDVGKGLKIQDGGSHSEYISRVGCTTGFSGNFIKFLESEKARLETELENL